MFECACVCVGIYVQSGYLSWNVTCWSYDCTATTHRQEASIAQYELGTRGSYSVVEHNDAHTIQIPRSIRRFIDIETGVDDGNDSESESREWDRGSLLFSGVGYCSSWAQIQTTLLTTGSIALIRAHISRGGVSLIGRRDWANF
jgi:hypothetical protein